MAPVLAGLAFWGKPISIVAGIDAKGYRTGREQMKMLMNGLSGWARMENTQNQSVKAIDTSITIVGTVLLAVTYMLIHHG